MTRILAGLGALAIALAANQAQADTLIDNVNGITVSEDGTVVRFTGIVIDDDGRVREIVKRGGDRPKNVDFREDGKGRVMLPGFIDAHAHVMGVGLGALTLDLQETNSLAEAQAAIRAFADANPSRPWIIGRGWNQEKWGLGRFPTASELDAVLPDRPVFMERVDGHAAWVNTEALKRASITAATKDPAGGRITRKAGSRDPEGVFVDAAIELVGKVLPSPRPEDNDLAFRKAQQIFFADGITAVADMGTSVEAWQTFRRAGDIGALKLRIMSYADSIASMELIAGPRPTPWLYEDRLRLNGIKLYMDGALGSRGALLKESYADEGSHFGLPLLSSAQLRNLMSKASMGEFQVAVHAIGDAANAEVLGAIEELSEAYKGDRRWRIEHAQIVDPQDIARFGKHGIIASMQPVHQTSDRLMAEARLGESRLDGAYAWRSIAAQGAPLAFGSDAPVERTDVFAGLAAAISRTDANGDPFGGWHPEEAVTREAAIAAYTAGGAYAGFAEGRFGKLVAGERADFILVDTDPLLASPSELRATRVIETWVGGEKVYSAN